MKILRKRIGSLQIENINEVKVINDSVFQNEEIIFNYLPIKNLKFFSIKLNKSDFGNKYWIYLDLNLNILYKEILNGKIIINRELIFDMVISSLNRLKIKNSTNDKLFLNEVNEESLADNETLKYDSFYCFDNSFVKYGKIYFDIKRKLITVDKCKKKRLKIPSFFVFKNYFQIKKTIVNLLNRSIIDPKNSLFIVSKKNIGLIESTAFNPFFKENLKNIIYSEDLNFQMKNYTNEINLEDFLSQLEFESSNFFFKKPNIFIFAENLSDLSISYLSFCNFEKIFFKNFKKIEKIIPNLTFQYSRLRINRNDKFDNILVSNYILLKRIFIISEPPIEIKYKSLQVNNFPWIEWKKQTDVHFLSLEKQNRFISNFIKIGLKDEWSESYLETIKNSINFKSTETCPISLTELDSYSVKTNCHHLFNLSNLITWLKENNECPICRNQIDIEKLEFNKNIDITNLVKTLYEFEKKIIIICDKLWFDKFNDNKTFAKKKNNIKLINQVDYVNGKVRKDKANNNCYVINFSGLTDQDLLFIDNIYNYYQQIDLVELC